MATPVCLLLPGPCCIRKKTIQTQLNSGIECYCFGVKGQLVRYINMVTKAGKEVPSEIQLSLNIDGLPLFRSSRKSLWPIIGLISNITPSVVFLIVITCENGKPYNLEVLDETIRELNSLMTNVLSIKGICFSILIYCVVCDAPARNPKTCTLLYLGYYYRCDKCTKKDHTLRVKLLFQSLKMC